jgi:5'-3' exonuclease
MGVEGINNLLKRHAANAFFTLAITELSGKRIAIDGNNWMYTNMATARKKVINKTDVATQEPDPREIRREWFLAAVKFVTGWLSYNITPVFVFDGQHPVEKSETKSKRRNVKIASKAKIDILYEQLNSDISKCQICDESRRELHTYRYISTEDFELFRARTDALYQQLSNDIMRRRENFVNKLEKELRNYISAEDFELLRTKINGLYERLNGDMLGYRANIVDGLRQELRNYNYVSNEDFELFKARIDGLYNMFKSNTLDCRAYIVEELRKELRNYNYISNEDFELFKTVIKGIGIPCLQATGDGEHLCSTLCVEGKVSAVFSVDTDNLVFGCPLLITGFSETYTYDGNGCRVAYLNCVRLDRVLEGLGINHSLFVDLCIMCGCDFNTNMPGYAAIKSFALLQKHGSIDNLPRNFDTTCLKHRRCREIFKYVPSNELTIVSNDISEPVTESFNTGLNIIHNEINPLDINRNAIAMARDYLEMAGISGQIDTIIALYRLITSSSDGHVQSLNLGEAPKYIPPSPQITLSVISRSPAVPILTPTITPIGYNNVAAVTVPLPNVPQPIMSAPQSKFLTLNIVTTKENTDQIQCPKNT